MAKTQPAGEKREKSPGGLKRGGSARTSIGACLDSSAQPAKNADAARFYQRYGFTASADQALTLFLPLW
jgi:hypothetical protein